MIDSNGGNEAGGKQETSRSFTWFAGILIVIVAVALYAKTYHYEMVFDDKHIISSNVSITSLSENPSGFLKLYTQEFWEGSHEGELEYLKPKGQALYRPVMLTMLGIVYYLFEKNPAPFHALNIITYAIVCLLCFIAVRKLFGSTRLAFFCGLIFACHPIHSESVAYITGFGELFSALFFLLALIFYLKASYDQDRFQLLPYCFSLLFFLVGLFTKEHVVTLIGVLVMYDILQAIAGRRPLGVLSRIGMMFGYCCMVGVNLFARYQAIGSLKPGEQNPVDNVIAAAQTYTTQLWTALRVLMKGIWMTILPLKQSPDYSYAEIALNQSPLEAEVLAAILFSAILLIIAFVSIKKRPIISFGIFWHLITIFVVSNLVIKVGTIFGERLLFLPSLGFCLIAAYILDRIFVLGADANKEARLRVGAAIATVLLIALAAGYAHKADKENNKWMSEEFLWDAAKKSCPNSAKIRFQLGQILAANKIFQEAEAEYTEALRIENTFFMAQLSLAELFFLQKQPEKAIMAYEQVRIGISELKDEKLETAVRVRLATLYGLLKKSDQAIEELMALKASTNTVFVNLQLGDLYMESKNYEKAAGFYQEAWDLAPEKLDAAYKLLNCFTLQERFDKEEELLGRLEELDTESNRVYLYRANVYIREIETEKALAALDKAIEGARDESQAFPAHLMKAGVLQSEFRLEEALESLEKAIVTIPAAQNQLKAEPLFRKMEIYMSLGDLDKAQEVAEQLSTFNQSPPLKAALGDLYLKLERYEEASKLLKESIVQVKSTANFVNLGKALAALNQYEDIVNMLTPAVEELKLADPDLYRILGVALNATGEYQKGVDLLKETLRLWGFNPWVRFQIGTGELELKNYDKAADILEAIEDNETVKSLRPFIYQLQARILLEDERRKDPEQALMKAKAAIEQHPSGGDAGFYLTLIKALEATGNVEEAKRIAGEAQERFPRDKTLNEYCEGILK